MLDPGSGARARWAGVRPANDLEAQLALDCADHVLQFTGFALGETQSVCDLAHPFLNVGVASARAGAECIIRKVPSAAMGRNPLTAVARLPASNQSISLPPRGFIAGPEARPCAWRPRARFAILASPWSCGDGGGW